MEKKCDSCGMTHMPDNGWVTCPDCGKVLCPRCAEQESHEDRQIEKLREGDAVTRLNVLCPSCAIQIIR
jgi:predicted RNA-binding Zn-ribbon protein involved in translation (DUF1610 family)